MGLLSLTGSILLDCIAIATLTYLGFGVRSYHRLSHIPGPKLWGWTLIPLFKSHVQGDTYEDFENLSQQYGPLVRIAPNTLLVADAEVVRRMNAARSPYTRASWYSAMRFIPGQDNVLSTLSDARHDELRSKTGSAYSGKENLTLEQDIDDCVRDLVRLLDDNYVSRPGGEVIRMDLARKMQFFTSDVMSKLAFDSKFHDLRDDHDNYGYINEVETVFPKIFPISVIPAFLDFMTQTGVLSVIAPSESSTFGLGKVLAITKEQVGKRFNADGKLVDHKKDMLGSFLRRGLSRDEAEQESVLQLAAGSDTTATGLRSTLLGLMQNTKAWSKLRAELDEAVVSGKISGRYDAVITDEQARKMPYLQACIKEGLRTLPPVVGMLPKQTPPKGDTICGYTVPGGVSIGWSAPAIHHSKELFGPDELSFRPDRWLHTSDGGDEPSREKIRVLDRNNELIFGYGRYMCLGKSVALIELNKVIAEVGRRYEMDLLNPEKPCDSTCYGVHLQKNMWVSVKKREGAKVVVENCL